MDDNRYLEIETPRGFDEAWEKYGHQDDGVETLWQEITLWRDFEAGVVWEHRDSPPAGEGDWWEEHLPKRITEFKEEILKAVFETDQVFLSNLLKALELSSPPEPQIDGIRAAVHAFFDLFISEGVLVSRKDWPTKRAVRIRAEQILREAGYPIPSKRHWTKIFLAAGLSELPEEKPGRPRKK